MPDGFGTLSVKGLSDTRLRLKYLDLSSPKYTSQEQEVSHSEILEVFKKNLFGVHFEYYILLITKTPFPLKGDFNFC